jgi:hypothetical protein
MRKVITKREILVLGEKLFRLLAPSSGAAGWGGGGTDDNSQLKQSHYDVLQLHIISLMLK